MGLLQKKTMLFKGLTHRGTALNNGKGSLGNSSGSARSSAGAGGGGGSAGELVWSFPLWTKAS